MSFSPTILIISGPFANGVELLLGSALALERRYPLPSLLLPSPLFSFLPLSTLLHLSPHSFSLQKENQAPSSSLEVVTWTSHCEVISRSTIVPVLTLIPLVSPFQSVPSDFSSHSHSLTQHSLTHSLAHSLSHTLFLTSPFLPPSHDEVVSARET